MNLVIIGNGFDMAHGLNTGYDKFRKFMKEEDYEEYEFLGKLFGEKFYQSEFWWNFEESLAYVDFENVLTNLSVYLGKLQKEYYDNSNLKKNLKESLIGKINKLKLLFCKWIKNIDETEVEKKSIKQSINEIIPDSMILSFNYTGTIEKLYKARCYHIHGYVGNINDFNEEKLNDIVLGHKFDLICKTNEGEDIPVENIYFQSDDGTKISFDEVSGFKEFDCSNNKIINESLSESDFAYEEIFTKRTSKIINDDKCNFFNDLRINAAKITDIYVLGHSLSDVDSPYLKEIVNIIKSKKTDFPKWHLSYYFNSEKNSDNKDELTEKLKKITENTKIDFISL